VNRVRVRGLLEHVRRELTAAEEPGKVRAAVETAVAHLAGAGDPARLAELVLRLVGREPLTPLTRDPAEWADRTTVLGVPVWQSLRNPAAFSDDAGWTYTLEDDPHQEVMVSVLPPHWIRQLRDRFGVPQGEAVQAVQGYLTSGPITDADLECMDRMDDARRRSYIVRRWPGPAMLVAAMLYRPPDDDEPGQQDDPARLTSVAA
jgi:hypothetical protein